MKMKRFFAQRIDVHLQRTILLGLPLAAPQREVLPCAERLSRHFEVLIRAGVVGGHRGHCERPITAAAAAAVQLRRHADLIEVGVAPARRPA